MEELLSDGCDSELGFFSSSSESDWEFDNEESDSSSDSSLIHSSLDNGKTIFQYELAKNHPEAEGQLNCIPEVNSKTYSFANDSKSTGKRMKHNSVTAIPNPSVNDRKHELYCHNRIVCDICGEHFDKESAFDVHRMKHLVFELFRCKICGEESRSKDDYLLHSQVHISRSLTCSICEKGLGMSRSFDSHTSGHTTGKAFYCSTCGKSFRFYSSFKRHSDAHKKSFICTICDETFTNKLACHQHRLKHVQKKVHPCDICGKEFHRPYQLIGHLQVHEEAKKYECKECSCTYAYKTSLLRHNLKYHSKSSLTFQCDQCGDLFRNRRTLNSHIILHTAKKFIKCDECPRTFKYYSSLKRHKLMHLGLKPFKCPQCKKSFRCKSHLKVHLAIHIPPNNFSCNRCDEKFAFNHLLKKHVSAVH